MSKKKDFKVQLTDEEYAEYLTGTEKPTTPSTEPVVVEPTNPANPVTGTGNNETATGGEEPTATPTNTPTTTPTMTYQEWYDNNIKRVTEKANEAYSASVNNAELTYQQALGSYGTNAERLASMGLTNSGYSDYLKTRAYDTYRSEVSAAEKLRSDTIADAELTYGEMLLDKQEKQKQNNLSSYITNAGNGLYTSDDIEKIIGNNGYTGSDADALRGEQKDYESAQNLTSADISNKIAGGNFANWNALSNYATAAGLDPETFKGEYANQLYNDISKEFSDYGTLNDAWMTDLKSVDEAMYDEIVDKYNKAVNTSSAFLDETGNMMDGESARKHLAKLLGDKYIDGEKKEELQNFYDNTYKIRVLDVEELKVKRAQIRVGREDNFFIKIGDDDRIKLELGGDKQKATNFPDVIQNLDDNTIFEYQGKYYLKKNGFVREIQQRNENQKEDWEKFVNLMTDNTTEKE